jgi:drug/metabolite transporter (DMT)-like permease
MDNFPTGLRPYGMYLGIFAVKHATASMLGPYTLLWLVIGVLGGVVIFHELPDILCTFGAVLVLASCVLSSGVSTIRGTLSVYRGRFSLGIASRP